MKNHLRLVRDDEPLPELESQSDAGYSANVFRLHMGAKMFEDACLALATGGVDPTDAATFAQCFERVERALYLVA